MPLDADAIARGCRGAQVKTANQLCRAEIERFRAAAASGDAAHRRLHAGGAAVLRSRRRAQPARSPSSICARPPAGRRTPPQAGPKMAALLAAAAEPLPEIPFVSLDSEGVALIYGRDERAIEAGKLLADHLDVTVLIARPKGLTPPRVTDFPVVQGTIRIGQGPSRRLRDRGRRLCRSRAVLARRACVRPAARRRGVALRSRARSLRRRAAVLRAPICATAICAPIRAIPPPCCAPCSRRAISPAPSTSRATSPSPRICARIRARRIVGCHRCLDLCPAGAIAPDGDHVAIDAKICAGCGQCAAACPTGAAAYALPPADALMRKLRVLLSAYREAGGEQPGRAAARRGPRRRR